MNNSNDPLYEELANVDPALVEPVVTIQQLDIHYRSWIQRAFPIVPYDQIPNIANNVTATPHYGYLLLGALGHLGANVTAYRMFTDDDRARIRPAFDLLTVRFNEIKNKKSLFNQLIAHASRV